MQVVGYGVMSIIDLVAVPDYPTIGPHEDELAAARAFVHEALSSNLDWQGPSRLTVIGFLYL